MSFAGSNGTSAQFSPLTAKDAALLSDTLNVPNVKEVQPALQLSRTTEYGSSQVRSQLVGIQPGYLEMIRWKVGSGRGLDEQDMVSNARVAILGQTTVTKLFPEGANPLGETIRVGDVGFRVIGVLEKYSGASFGDDNNDVVVIPLTTAQTRLQTERNISGELPVSVIVMQATGTATIDDAVKATTAFLHRQHKIKPGKEDDFVVTTTKDLIKSFDAIIGILTVFLSIIGGISLLVGGIGVMNIMMVTVTERTREIGLRKAVGARYRDIMLQFLTEATVLCFVGGAVGLYLALVVILGMRAAIPDLNPAVSMRSIILAVGVTSFIGIFFGLYPASRAASLDPIAALRSE
jgi:putative ABC transport system permease protein